MTVKCQIIFPTTRLYYRFELLKYYSKNWEETGFREVQILTLGSMEKSSAEATEHFKGRYFKCCLQKTYMRSTFKRFFIIKIKRWLEPFKRLCAKKVDLFLLLWAARIKLRLYSYRCYYFGHFDKTYTVSLIPYISFSEWPK